MEREKLKLASLDLDFMEVKQMFGQKTNNKYVCPDYKAFKKTERERTTVDLSSKTYWDLRLEDLEGEYEGTQATNVKKRDLKYSEKLEEVKESTESFSMRGSESSGHDAELIPTKYLLKQDNSPESLNTEDLSSSYKKRNSPKYPNPLLNQPRKHLEPFLTKSSSRSSIKVISTITEKKPLRPNTRRCPTKIQP